MKPRIHTLLPLAALAGLALSATSANAAPIATLTSEAKNGEPHTGPLIVAASGDLLETVGSVAAEGGSGDGIRQNTATVFDGAISTGIANGAQTAANAGGYWGAGHFVEFDLDTTTNTLGYDISSIATIQVGDGFRPGQAYTVQLRTVGGSFSDLLTVPDQGTGGNVNEIVIADDGAALLGTGVDGIRFNFANTGVGWTVYRELDVIGTVTGAPTDTTPPTLASSDIVDDQGGAAVEVNMPVTYTVTFSEDMNASTVTSADFGDKNGDVSLSFGAITETSPGVFTVEVTPTSTGTLQLQVNMGAELKDLANNPLDTSTAIIDDTPITVAADATAPTLAPADIVDDQSGGPIPVGTQVIYTLTFSEDMDHTTVTLADFDIDGTATVTFGVVLEDSPGVFSIDVTPDTAGTMRLKVVSGASLTDTAGNPLATGSDILDDTEITVEAVTVVSTLTSEAKNGEPHTGPLISATSGDLLETVGSVAAEGGNGSPARHVTASVFDGSISTSISNTPLSPDTDGGYWGAGHFIEFDLDTTTNTLGYDISSITTIQVGDGFRPGQAYTVQLRTVGGSFVDLLTIPDQGTGGNVNEIVITNPGGGLLATGVDGIRFNFADTGVGWTVYREIDVVGSVTGGGGNDFSDWIAGYSVGGQTGINDDPDGDGVDSGVESFFGTAPDTFTQGLVSEAADTGAGTFTFTHPQTGTIADDLTATYQWSVDLENFFADGVADGEGTKVDFTVQLNTPEAGTTTVTATVDPGGTATTKLFVDVEVTQD